MPQDSLSIRANTSLDSLFPPTGIRHFLPMSENIIIKHGTVTGNLFDLTYYGAEGFQESSTFHGGLGLAR